MGSLPRITAPALTVRTPDGTTHRFSRSFHIGRDRQCELSVEDVHVSRRHAVVLMAEGRWSLRDLQSANGIFVDGRQLEIVPIEGDLIVSLGHDGPRLAFTLEQSAPRATTQPSSADSGEPVDEAMQIDDYADRYFGGDTGEVEVGGRTMMIRRAFNRVQRQQKRRYRWMVAVMACVALAAGGYAFYSYRQLSKQQAIAEQIFYSMKSIDVNIADVERRIATTGAGQDQVRRYRDERRKLEANYDQFVAGLSSRNLSEQDRLILRVTRALGECDLAAPSDYIREVHTYIRKWQASGRFVRAAKLAQDTGYTRVIVEELLKQSLAPQFFYLAMQESDFEPFRSGPPTKWGIAKGMWQFIPETGARYGLKIGPLAKSAAPDKEDERLHWDKATVAAARYIKDIYSTDAQASGLLVMASYNWGEGRVINLLRTMPADPRERNFWKLLERYRDRLPLQTYDYVFYIVSAAVIGENPRLFGFPMDNPLAAFEKS
jgi:peptidoglycan lytic transglycosylase D